jgi:hypothetical protein
MAHTYQFTIELSPATVDALTQGNFSLLAFQGVQTTAAEGQPVVWIQVTELATTIQVSWSPVYAAYIGQSPIVVDGMSLASSMAPIDFGQILQVGQNGVINVTDGGPAGAMSVLNTTTTPWTCGLIGMTTIPAPITAFPLYGNAMIGMVPGTQVLFVFGSYPTQPGQILDRTLAQGVLVDFSTGDQRSATFDINTGWSFGGQSWAQIIPPNTSLQKTLIHAAPLALVEHVAEINGAMR